ncbi:MAG TPA: twin-arginine translocase subunit TatC [Roseiflexaceae bacterium]|jgi:sec-independent protein translocase protein TatC|nr:twin-arginine translocase subunit TatC [Roseiflexaceae bacterium]
MTLSLPWIAGIIIFLLLTPVLAMLLVRRLIPMTEVEEEEIALDEPSLEFESLRDFWESMVPHLTELRDRMMKAGGAVILGTVISSIFVFNKLIYGKSLTDIVYDQFVPAGVKLLAATVAEAFVNSMHIALLVGLVFALPVVAYQIFAFFAPALNPLEKRMVFTSIPFITELFIAGLVFGWFITVPAAVGFLTTFDSSDRVQNMPTVTSVVSIVTTLLLWNGAIFELPAIIYLLARLGVVTTETLARTRRYAIAIIVVAAAVITPTGDPYNLALLAVPMYLLYEMGIVLTRFVPKREPKEESVGSQ